MKKTITFFAAMLFAGTAVMAAPKSPDRGIDKKPAAPGKPAHVAKPGNPGKPAKPALVVKPAPLPPAPVVKPAPVLPPPPPVVTYQPVRNTYTIQLNANNSILFEQRLVGMQELRDKIRMVKFDRPRPLIRIRIADGVNSARLNFALSELKAAGFDDVEIIRLSRRTKAPRVHKPGKRIKR